MAGVFLFAPFFACTGSTRFLNYFSTMDESALMVHKALTAIVGPGLAMIIAPIGADFFG